MHILPCVNQRRLAFSVLPVNRELSLKYSFDQIEVTERSELGTALAMAAINARFPPFLSRARASCRSSALRASSTDGLCFRRASIQNTHRVSRCQRANDLWSGPVTGLASIRDSPIHPCSRPYVPVRADVNTDAIAPIVNVVGREYRVGRVRSRPSTRLRPRHAAVNPLQINDFAPSAEYARAWLAAPSRGQRNGTMPIRGGRRDCARQGDRD